MKHLWPTACRQLIFLAFGLFFLASQKAVAQNDDCATPQTIAIGNSGFATGVFSSTPVSITGATVQTSETFAPAILVAGQTQKSLWFKFTLPTTRNVKVTLAQEGTAITAGDVGFAVYKNATCLPTNAMISNKLTPLPVFGNTTHPCTEPGDYLVQVSAKAVAAGNILVLIETALPAAAYDRPAQAYNFGTLAMPNFTRYIDYAIDCQSLEDATEKCTSLANNAQYTKSTWHVFKTPAYFDYVSVLLSGTGGSTYFVSSAVFQKFGYTLYAGDVRSTAISSLTIVDGCDSLQTNGYVPDRKIYKCTQLQANTTYTVQLFHHKDFENNIRLAVTFDGTAATKAPEPVSALVPASNKLGILPASAAGITTTFSDQFACNSLHSLHPCNSLPAGGVRNNNLTYNLSTFFTFTLSGTSRLAISGSDAIPPNRYFSTPFLIKIYKQDIGSTCNFLDTANLAFPSFLSNAGFSADCVLPGNYTIQLLGRDSIAPAANYYYAYLANPSYVLSLLTDLGKKFNVSINVKTLQAVNNYPLDAPGAVDTINRVGNAMQALLNNITYMSKPDTFGCGNTVRPVDTTCASGNNKVIYREFAVADSGVLSISSSSNFFHKLYMGDAQALAAAQNAYTSPARITGLTPYTKCLQYNDCDGTKVCVVPGTYSHLTFGGDAGVGQTSQPSYRFNVVNTTYANPAAPENLGALNPGSSLSSTADYFSCKDNAIPINGYQPCSIGGVPATKAIYRQFYLSAPATLNISDNNFVVCGYYGSLMTLFRGKISDGLTGLTPVGTPFQCFQSASSTNLCNALEAGWYTVVSYGSGPSYANPFQNVQTNGYGGYVGRMSKINISATAGCAAPKYNRPYKAAIDIATNQPFLLQWAPRVGHTAAYPKTDTTYTLPIENFNCTVDTPFASHPIPDCNNSLTKVAYYVFKTTQESYIKIDTKYFWGAVYAGNARTDSASFAGATPIQTCLQSTGFIQICKLQPGTYTLAVFATSAQNCTTVQPTIYIDQVGFSRFDYAATAYDFGILPPDSLYYSGKTGDVNPLNPLRAASSDFIYCTTGAAQNNPADPACGVTYNPNIYPARNDAALFTSSMAQNVARRNLWYTFVAEHGGYVRIRVANKTLGKTGNVPVYAVYRSNVNGNLPFNTVVANGEVDSTAAQGLTMVVRSGYSSFCYQGYTETNFYRDPCNATKERYYILVENPYTYPIDISGQQPNAQFDVSILIDSVNAIQPKFDHYFQASSMGTNLGTGTFTGATDNYSCATKDANDPTYSYTSCATKTLWYKFTTNVTGHVRYRVMINGVNQYGLNYLQLYRQVIPNDSTATGLQIQNTANAGISDAGYVWTNTCVSPGTYYLMLTGCNSLNEYTYPVIKLVEEAGDFCSAPVAASLIGPGTATAAVTVDCHTIGTDYGEFNPNLTCPNGVPKGLYKSSWFRIDITGNDTLDVTTFLTESTNALPSEIKYRMMKGNCGAMQEQSCVQDALTQDTYKCLVPGSYFVQVFTPVTKTGSPVNGIISLNLLAVKHVDTCAPVNNCLSTATFIPQYDCTTNDYVTFNNFSTYGSAIQYQWDFGYNGQTSNAVSPVFKYPELNTAQTYTVTLTATNTGCSNNTNNTSSTTQTITIPARPNTALPNDTTLCVRGTTMVLNATSWAGSTYQWQNGATTPTFTATASGTNTYWVRATYNGCIKRDTIVINSNPNTRLLQTKYLCGADSVLLNSTRGNGETFLWNTGQTTPSVYASVNGLYINDVTWKGCVVKDSFNILKAAEPWAKADTTICFPFKNFTLNAATPGALSYQWQNNSTSPTYAVTAPGVYWVNIWNGTCTKKDTVTVITSAAPKDSSLAVSRCAGQGYVLPWGVLVNASGVYRDTARYASGCDSLRQTVNVTFIPAATSATSASVCNGQSYTLPWGTVVTASGIYRDTLKSVSGCDSLVRIVNVSLKPLTVANSNAGICASQTYTLPWGTVVNASGIYRDTVRYQSGCDSLIRSVHLTVKPLTVQATTASVCSGQPYTLPWGTPVTTPGVYRDTVRYVSGCDSLIRAVTLMVNTPLSANSSASICAGQTYTLPWGTVVNLPGTYRDTFRYQNGCDSLVRSVIVGVKTVAQQNTLASVCSGQSYTLPWGLVVNTSGIYRDTLRYTAGCDSVRREVILTVKSLALQSSNAAVCSGQNYTLPWGTVVSAAGIYHDTIKYVSGCDSLIRNVTLAVNNALVVTNVAAICTGQSYTLPSGGVVTSPGIYRDTIRYANGCDSLVRSISLSVKTVAQQTSAAAVCQGQTYTLPWGTAVTAGGIYRDTLRYTTGCDSVQREITLTVKPVFAQNTATAICAGQSYTLPWGVTVNAAGTYRDTIRYAAGCDSLVRSVVLRVAAVFSQSSSATVCKGQNYTLPWGTVVSLSGLYHDTVRYTSGCDSLVRSMSLTVQASTINAINKTVCSGQAYVLPWGQSVFTSGIYRDTLHYASGCDSLIRQVDLTVKNLFTASSTASICSGSAYALPWGTNVSSAGIYRDTIRYASGCDSLIRSVDLRVTAPAVFLAKPVICSNETYRLPWGPVVNAPGTYRDTVRGTTGCDSLVRTVQLTVNTQPVVRLSKSNDVDCVLGTSKLVASGGEKYLWSPVDGLSNPAIANPVASPTTSTMYRVTVTGNNGCVNEDSLYVTVAIGNAANGYPVASAFTPNKDGRNDCFGISNWGDVKDLEFSIFNRWGQLLFYTSDKGRCWDGTVSGVAQKTDVYVYVIKAKTVCGPVLRKGTVTLIR